MSSIAFSFRFRRSDDFIIILIIPVGAGVVRRFGAAVVEGVGVVCAEAGIILFLIIIPALIPPTIPDPPLIIDRVGAGVASPGKGVQVATRGGRITLFPAPIDLRLFDMSIIIIPR